MGERNMQDAFFDRTSKNQRLKEIIRDAVLNGTYPPGSLLPSQNEMCAHFGVSIHTVREAVASLVHEGLLDRVHGKGTFVAHRRLDRSTIAFVTTRLHRDLGTHYRLGYDTMPVLVQALEEEARSAGMSTVLCLDHNNVDLEREILTQMVNRQVGGIVLFYIGGEHNLDCLQMVKQSGIPLVLVDRRADGVTTDCVTTDNFKGAYDAVAFLLDRGFRNVYHFTLGTDSSSIRDRLAGYKQALEDHGIGFDEARVKVVCTDGFPNIAIGADFHGSQRLMTEVLAQESEPIGVFAATPAIVTGVWRAAERAGLAHDRIGLACFDVPIQSIPHSVSLIKVVQPLEKMARECVRIVRDKHAGLDELQRIVMEPSYRTDGPGAVPDARHRRAPDDRAARGSTDLRSGRSVTDS